MRFSCAFMPCMHDLTTFLQAKLTSPFLPAWKDLASRSPDGLSSLLPPSFKSLPRGHCLDSCTKRQCESRQRCHGLRGGLGCGGGSGLLGQKPSQPHHHQHPLVRCMHGASKQHTNPSYTYTFTYQNRAAARASSLSGFLDACGSHGDQQAGRARQ